MKIDGPLLGIKPADGSLPKITAEFAKKFIGALKSLRSYDSAFQFMNPKQVSLLGQISDNYVKEGLFRSDKPEQVLATRDMGITTVQSVFQNIAEAQSKFENPESSLAVMLETAPSEVRMLIDFLSDANKGSPKQHQLMFPKIDDTKLAKITARTDYDTETQDFTPGAVDSLHEQFKAWFVDRIDQRTNSTLSNNRRTAIQYFDNQGNFEKALNGVSRVTSKYLEAVKSGASNNTASVAVFQAKQLQAQAESSAQEAQAKFEELREPSKAYVDKLITEHGSDYVIRNKAENGMNNLVAVTDKGPQEGRVKTYNRINSGTKRSPNYTAQLTNMTLANLKARVDSGTVVIVDIEPQPKGFTKITLDQFRTKHDKAFYEAALEKLTTES